MSQLRSIFYLKGDTIAQVTHNEPEVCDVAIATSIIIIQSGLGLGLGLGVEVRTGSSDEIFKFCTGEARVRVTQICGAYSDNRETGIHRTDCHRFVV